MDSGRTTGCYFSNNDNLDEVVFEVAIIAFDVKGEDSSVKDTKNHKKKS